MGNAFFSGGADRTVRMWDISASEESHILDKGGKFTGLAFTPDGRNLISCSSDRSVRVWKGTNSQVVLGGFDFLSRCNTTSWELVPLQPGLGARQEVAD